LEDASRSVIELRTRVADLHKLEPGLDAVEKKAQRIHESTASIESRRQFVDELNRRITELGALSSRMDERGQQLAQRMDAAEERFWSLGDQAETAEKVAQTLAGVPHGVDDANRQVGELKKSVETLTERCESVEALAGETQALRKELEQRARA